MTTATVNTVVDHTGDAGFRVWVAEVIAQLLAVGLTQTADTGQINTVTVTRPGTNTSAGYAVFRFNDTAHSTSPVFFRIDFGTASTAAIPRMLITVGTGSNGTGTINGTVMTQVCVTNAAAISSVVTPYVSRFCYNTTQGFLGMVWKISGSGTTNLSLGGFFIYRSADSAGAVTTDSVMLITNSGTTVGTTSNNGLFQAISYLTSLAYNTGSFPSTHWGVLPFNVTSTLYLTNGQLGEVFQYTPVLGVTPDLALGVISEVGLGSTVTLALVGATTHTFLQVGSAFGISSLTIGLYGQATVGILMLWE